MLITKTSHLSQVTRTRDLNITKDQICAYMCGALIQDAFPNLDADDREFYKTGTTPEEWEAMFKEDDDDH